MTASSRSRRRTVAWAAGGLFALATAVLVWVLVVSSATSGASSVLIGSLDQRSLLSVSVSVVFVSLCVGLWSVDSPRWMLPLKIIGVALSGCAAALAAFVSMMIVDVNVTPLLHDGCDTGYVVVERAFLMGSSGTVYRQDDSFLVTEVARTSGDDAYQPFSMGGYAVTESAGSLVVAYAVNRPLDGASVSPSPGTSFSVPVLRGRTPQCEGASGPTPNSTPKPDAPPVDDAPATVASIDEALRERLRASLNAASGTVVDAAGTPIDPAAVSISSIPCPDQPGTRREMQIDFRSEDNARSLEQILEVWDQAGYEKDRAIQEDIRFSAIEPVARMSVKDRSSIDGLIHMTLHSVCGISE